MLYTPVNIDMNPCGKWPQLIHSVPNGFSYLLMISVVKATHEEAVNGFLIVFLAIYILHPAGYMLCKVIFFMVTYVHCTHSKVLHLLMTNVGGWGRIVNLHKYCHTL